MNSKHPLRNVPLGKYALITLPGLLLLALFAYTAGYFSPHRITQKKIVDQLETNGGVHAGYRRNHAKGICITGYFEASGLAKNISSTEIFQPGRSNVLGRLSLPGGDPIAVDADAPLRSMALQIRSAHGEEWRTAMLSAPVFLVATPEAFFAQLKAAAPDPATGKPDPKKMQDFFAAHPESAAFLTWIKSEPKSSSYANTSFNSLNSFQATNDAGESRYIRWSMRSQQSFSPLPADAVQDPDYFLHQLQGELKTHSLRWQLQLQLAEAGDAINNATSQWPPERKTINAGELVITNAIEQREGACRDINYDPLILPKGITPSDDPLLNARSAAYSESTRRRLHEQTEPATTGFIDEQKFQSDKKE